MIKRPPFAGTDLKVLERINQKSPEKLDDYLTLHTPVDSKGRYLHFDELYYRLPSGLDPGLAWGMVKLARSLQQQPLLEGCHRLSGSHFMLTPTIQRATSLVDRHTNSGQLEVMMTRIGERAQLNILLEDLTEDEAISSSQLEGAATTTIVARDMIRSRRKPRNPDERMIVGNFSLMRHAWKARNQPLTPELIKEFHSVATRDIDDGRYQPGACRNTDDVVVEHRDGNVVHHPPPASELESCLSGLCKWANVSHDEVDRDGYLHPMVKAVMLHFALGFLHPFRDGNGRVARALFYWFMFRSDYAVFRFISISVLLKEAAASYGKAYLYTETDDMDLTYFIEHQSKTIGRAIEGFLTRYRKSVYEIERFQRWLVESGMFQRLNEKQRIILQVAHADVAREFTARYVAENLDCARNTAAQALSGLVDAGLFQRRKSGREWVYWLKERAELLPGKNE